MQSRFFWKCTLYRKWASTYVTQFPLNGQFSARPVEGCRSNVKHCFWNVCIKFEPFFHTFLFIKLGFNVDKSNVYCKGFSVICFLFILHFVFMLYFGMKKKVFCSYFLVIVYIIKIYMHSIFGISRSVLTLDVIYWSSWLVPESFCFGSCFCLSVVRCDWSDCATAFAMYLAPRPR